MTTVAALASPPAFAATGAQTTQGTDFWVGFEGNYTGASSLYLFAAGDVATSGTVAIPGIAFTAAFTVTPGVVTQVTIPSNAQDLTSDVVGNLGIHITSQDPVSVYGLNTYPATSDGYLGLPTNILGIKYLVEAYTNDIGTGSQFQVIATQDNTTVTITPSEDVAPRVAGTPYTITLNQGQTYQLNDSGVSSGDLTGTAIAADHPVAVFAGSNCADVPAGIQACNTLTEEMTPTSTWGESFVTEPLATRIGGDTFRFLASQDNTTVKVNGVVVANLNTGKFFETTLPGASVITSDNPIHVMQYSNGQQSDGVDADPFAVTIAPSAQFLNSYTVTTEPDGADPSITSNYINVVAPTSEVGAVTLDGVVIPAGSFTAIAGSSFSGAQLSVAFGSHVLKGSLPFGITVYGYGGYDGYGYPGGFTLSPIATVSKVTLSLAGGGTGVVGTQACATATVTDQNSAPLEGVRVDFTVTGVNPNAGFAYSDASGLAKYCYTGTAVGNDSIVAAVQALQSSPATWVWTAAKVNHAPTANAQSVTTPQNTAMAVTLTGSDPDSDTLTYAVGSAPAHGTLSGTAPNLTYTPTAGYSGPDSFTFTTNDGALSSAPATVSITVTKVNHAPTANAQSVTTSQNTAVAVTLSGSDPDSDTLTYAVGSAPAHGTLSGTAPNLTYTPTAGYSGPDSFTFTTNDGALSSAPATVSITVSPPLNSCPTSAPAQDVSVSADQNVHSSTLTSPAFTTAGSNDLVLAFVAGDGPEAPTQTVKTVTGGGLTWTLVVRSNKAWGTTEVWQAHATGKLTNAVVTATLAKSGFDGSITVVAFTGAAAAVGSSASGFGTTGAPSAKITPAGCNSTLMAVGHDWTHATAPVAVAGQVLGHVFVDKKVHDSFWTQKATAATVIGTAVTFGDSVPVKDRWTMAVVEIPAV